MSNIFAMLRPLDFEGYRIPAQTRDALVRYYEDGLMPGSFLTAVLCNDLMGAVGRADSTNRECLNDICAFVYNAMPANTWGSAEAMRKHTERVWAMKQGQEQNG